MYIDSSDLELCHDGGNEQLIVIIFPSVSLPPQGQVVAASILFDVDEVRPGQSDVPTTIAIFGEKNAFPAPVSSTAFDISNRQPTKSAVRWNPEPTVAVHDRLLTPPAGGSHVQQVVF